MGRRLRGKTEGYIECRSEKVDDVEAFGPASIFTTKTTLFTVTFFSSSRSGFKEPLVLRAYKNSLNHVVRYQQFSLV